LNKSGQKLHAWPGEYPEDIWFENTVEGKAAKSLNMSFVYRSICCLSYGPVPSTQSIYLRHDATDATEEEEIKFNFLKIKKLTLTWIRMRTVGRGEHIYSTLYDNV
jgi:hypothetical protein